MENDALFQENFPFS